MKRVFIYSPFRAANLTEWSRNMLYAQELCRFALDNDCAPFAPHLIYPGILDDENEAERSCGIRAGLMFMQACQELWLGLRYGLSEGMNFELHQAQSSVRIPVFVIMNDGDGGLVKAGQMAELPKAILREKRPQSDSDVQSQHHR